MGLDNDKSREWGASKLRRHAEERLRAQMSELYPTQAEHETQRLLHELEVHQVELEMQNDELRLARQELETSLEKYTDLYEFAPVGYVTLGHDGIILAANLTGATLLGVERSRLIGRRFGLFVTEEQRAAFSAFLDKIFIGGGEETCEVELTPEGSHPLFVQIEARADGGRECRIALIDISGRKILESQLLQAQKMETVGLLAGGIAHDFNNILNVIVGYGSLSEMNLQENDPLRGHLRQILEAADRGANLTRSLLNFSRKHLISPQPTNIADIIQNVDKFLTRLIGEDVRLKTDCGENNLRVTADGGQIEQVLINLATNARHAMPNGGTLAITSEAFVIDPDFIKAHGFGKPGEYALISVRDTGSGMDRETVGRIFEPFFTTKTLGKGTGLGLSIVYSIIKQHHGYIDVASEPDKGTTFRIYLPLTHEEQTPEMQVLAAPPRKGTETILLAEDDNNVRILTEKILTGLGYRIISTVDGEDAVKKFLVHKDTIQMLLFDLIMPNRNGKEAYDEIRKVSPKMRILFMSGYTADTIETQSLDFGQEIISKPFSPSDLARKVRMILDVNQP